jgi:hypothetical protein
MYGGGGGSNYSGPGFFDFFFGGQRQQPTPVYRPPRGLGPRAGTNGRYTVR